MYFSMCNTFNKYSQYHYTFLMNTDLHNPKTHYHLAVRISLTRQTGTIKLTISS